MPRRITPATNPQAFENGGTGMPEDLDGPEDWRVPVNPQAQPPEDDTPDDDDPRATADRLRAALSRPGDALKVKLYRRERTGALAWCADYSPREFLAGDLEMVREQWGPGDYQVRLIGAKGLAMREDLTLARPLERPQAPAGSARDEMLAQVLAQLAQGQQAIVQALAARPDPKADLQQTLAIIASMRDAFAPPPAPAAPAVNPSTMLADIVGAVRQLREVAAEVNPPAADPSDPMAMLPTIIEMVKTGQQAQLAGLPAVGLPASMIPPAAPAMDEPAIPRDGAPAFDQETASMPAPTVSPIQRLVLRGLLNRLMGMARAQDPPEKAAAWILEKAPDELIGYLDLDTAVDMLVSVAPEAQEHRAWLELVRAKAVELLDAEDPGAA